jgi:hypothetical protein
MFSPPPALTSRIPAAAASTGCAASRAGFSAFDTFGATAQSSSMLKRSNLWRDAFSSPSPSRECEVMA